MTRPTRRNDACPCGSRRKYKHCCLAVAQPAEASVSRRDVLAVFGKVQAGDLDSAWADCLALRRGAPEIGRAHV